MKKIVIAALLAVAAAAGFAYAHGGYGNGMYGYGNHMMDGYPMMGPGMTGGAYGCPMTAWTGSNAAAGQYDKFLDNTVSLRKQLHDAEFNYYEARRDPNTNPERLQAMEKEISELQAGLQEQVRSAYR